MQYDQAASNDREQQLQGLVDEEDEYKFEPPARRDAYDGSDYGDIEEDGDRDDYRDDEPPDTDVTRKGPAPKPAPSGAHQRVKELCDAEPMVGHIKVYDLAYVLGISHYNLLSLPRSFRGYVSRETAVREVDRRSHP